MSRPPLPTDESGQLAGEYALGLLTGDELAEARRRFAEDAEFRAEVGRWLGRLAPLLDEIPAAQPPATLWRRIEQNLGSGRAANDNETSLRRRVAIWRGATAAALAVAASLALVMITRPDPVIPPAVTPAPVGQPLFASLSDEGQATRLFASWNPAEGRLVIAEANAVEVPAGSDRELWVIPAGGAPQSLGTIGGEARAVVQPGDALTAELREGATLAVSIEPAGGSPTGQPTGPVVVTGTLEPV